MFIRLSRLIPILFGLTLLVIPPMSNHLPQTASQSLDCSTFDAVYGDPHVIDLRACWSSLPGGGFARVRRGDGKILGTFAEGEENHYFRDDGLSPGESYTYILENVESDGDVTLLRSFVYDNSDLYTYGSPAFDLTWAGGEYQLHYIFLDPGVTLTIQPGTVVVDISDNDDDITFRGGQLYVDGAIFRDGGSLGDFFDMAVDFSADLTQSRFTTLNSTFENSDIYLRTIGAERFEGNHGAMHGSIYFVSPRGALSVRDNEFPGSMVRVEFPDTMPLPLATDSLTLADNHLGELEIDGCTSSDGWATCFTRYSGPVDIRDNRFSCAAGRLWLYDLDSPAITIEGNRASDECLMELDWGDTGAFERIVRANSGFSILLGADGTVVGENQIGCNNYYSHDASITVSGSDNQILNNTFQGCGGDGFGSITLGGTSNVVAGNIVNGGDYHALYLQDAFDNHIHDNTFRTLWGYVPVDIDANSTQNQFDNNVFISAPSGNWYSEGCSNIWNTALTPGTNIVGGPNRGGNYWSRYTGSDADGDGTGDTPYLFDDGCGDQYPLIAADLPELSVVPFALHPFDATYDGSHYHLPLDVLVQNNGIADATDVSIRLSDNGGWSDTRVLTQAVAGEMESLYLDWDLTPLLLAGNGVANAQLNVAVDPARAIAEWNDQNNAYTAQAGIDARPRLLEVRPEYTLSGAYYLDNTSVPNRLSVFVDWNGALPGRGSEPYGEVVFDLNGVAAHESGQDWGAAHTYDLGNDFVASFECANNLLRIKAALPVAGGVLQSLETVIQPTVFPFPGWVEWAIANIPGSDAAFETRLAAPLVEYRYDFLYPEEPFEATWTPPTWIPYLGGQELGILETQGGFNLLGQSNGLGTVAAQGTTGLGLAAFTAQGTVFGQGEARFICGESLDLTRAELGFEIQAAVEQETGLVDLVSAVRASENWPVVGRVIRWVNESATVKGSFTPAISVLTLFEEQDDALAFISGEGTGRIAARAELAVDPVEDLSASVYGGGEPYLTLQVPADPGYLKEVGINLLYGATFQAWSFEAEYERQITCRYPGTCTEPDEGRAAHPAGWHIVSRDYAGKGYATFAAPEQQTGLAAGATPTETLLLTNIYPRPQPALALDGAQRLLAIVHDDLADPAGRGTEIVLLPYDGAAWSAPVAITADQQPDYAPALAYDGAGRGVIVWEHATLATGITPTLNITFAQSLEIHACAWNGVTCTVPTALTNDSLMDYAPQLATLTGGDVLALWQTGDGVDMMGTITHPITLTTALWDSTAGSWGASQTALSGLHDVTGLAFAARASNQAALVYARDMDGDLLTPGDSELYYSTYDGSAWTAPTRLMTDTLPDNSPALAYDATGKLHLIWLRDAQLAWLDDTWDMASLETLHAADEGGFIGFDLSSAANGNLALTWQAMGDAGPNLAYSLFDAASVEWSAPQTLLADPATEASSAPAFGSDGSLYLAYRKTAVATVTQTVTVSPTLSYTITNIPTPGQSDLAFLVHTVGRDLAWQSFTVAPPDPVPGEVVTLTGVLRSAGDLTVPTPQVAFYDGAVLIDGVHTLPDLASGTTATLAITWTLPLTPSTAHTLRAVADPNALVSETDEANNGATFGVNLPDLFVDAFYTEATDGTLIAIARLRNTGHSSVLVPFTVTVRAEDSLVGAVLAEVGVPALDAGAAVTLTVPLTGISGIDALWLIADSASEVDESNEDDNAVISAAGYLPDLTLSAADIVDESGLAVVVHNIGLITATNVPVEVRMDGLAGTLLYGGTIAAIPAGSSATLPVNLPAGSYTVFVKADPSNVIVERDESNNAGINQVTVLRRIYLPVVVRK